MRAHIVPLSGHLLVISRTYTLLQKRKKKDTVEIQIMFRLIIRRVWFRGFFSTAFELDQSQIRASGSNFFKLRYNRSVYLREEFFMVSMESVPPFFPLLFVTAATVAFGIRSIQRQFLARIIFIPCRKFRFDFTRYI